MVNVAVLTVTLAGVLRIGPTFVVKVAVLLNVPCVVDAFALKMNVRELVAGTVTAGENVQVSVPLAPPDGEVVGEPSVPAPLLTYVNPGGSASVI
jgi:hypothetical protein